MDFYKFDKKYAIFVSIISIIFLAGISIGTNFINSSEFNKILDPIVKSSNGKYVSDNDYENRIIGVVDKTSPSVVSIIISKNVNQCSSSPFSNLPPDIQQFFGFDTSTLNCPPNSTTTMEEIGGGTGFIISTDGYIITNRHVVLDKTASYSVLTNDGKKFNAQVIDRDPVYDLAIIKINAQGLSVLPLGDSDTLRLGQTSIVIGNALGEFKNTVSVGVISGLQRTIVASGSLGQVEKIEGVIQTDAAVNSGNSGGPLLNLKGEVVGINVATVVGAQSIGFAIPINQAKKAIDSVKKTGQILEPYIGVKVITITPDLAQRQSLPLTAGALVKNDKGVISGSPADRAGIKGGDIITQVNGQKISPDLSLTSLLQRYNVGDVIELTIFRDKKELNIKVILDKRPDNVE